MFPTHEYSEPDPTFDGVAKSVGVFILHFGKIEYALMTTIIEINRIIDGSTIQAKFPYSFEEMCKFFRLSETHFLDVSELPPFDQIADELEDLNKIRVVLVHSYLSTKTTKPEGTWFRFDRFAPVPGIKNRREMQEYQVKKEFIDDSVGDLKKARSWLIQLTWRLEKMAARNG